MSVIDSGIDIELGPQDPESKLITAEDRRFQEQILDMLESRFSDLGSRAREYLGHYYGVYGYEKLEWNDLVQKAQEIGIAMFDIHRDAKQRIRSGMWWDIRRGGEDLKEFVEENLRTKQK